MDWTIWKQDFIWFPMVFGSLETFLENRKQQEYKESYMFPKVFQWFDTFSDSFHSFYKCGYT